MFDRWPPAQLVADLVAMQSSTPVVAADRAAVDLIEQAVAWERVSGWVELLRLDTLRRLEAARIAADTAICDTPAHGLCERSHLAKHHPRWRVSGDARSVVTWQTPTGHRYTSTPPPATGYGTGPPCELDTPREPPDWLSFQQRLRYVAEHPPPGAPFGPSC